MISGFMPPSLTTKSWSQRRPLPLPLPPPVFRPPLDLFGAGGEGAGASKKYSGFLSSLSIHNRINLASGLVAQTYLLHQSPDSSERRQLRLGHLLKASHPPRLHSFVCAYHPHPGTQYGLDGGYDDKVPGARRCGTR
jgi:hypothetical protein